MAPDATAKGPSRPGRFAVRLAALAICLVYAGAALRSFDLRQSEIAAQARLSLPLISVNSAKSALKRDPLDQQSLASLGAALVRDGELAPANAAFALAARLGWRDQATAITLIDQQVQRRDYRGASRRLDAVLRLYPSLLVKAELLAPFERDPAGRVALARHMVLGPEWVRLYTDDWSGLSAGERLRRGAVLEEVARQGRSVGCPGAVAAAEGLLAIHADGPAREVWRAHCHSQEARADGYFDFDRRGGPFVWSLLSDGALDVRREDDGSQGRRLLVTNTASWTIPFATRAFPGDPGRYRLSWAGADSAEAPVVASVGCGRAEGSWELPTRDRITGRWSVGFTAEERCAVRLTLAVRPNVQQSPLAQITVTPRAD